MGLDRAIRQRDARRLAYRCPALTDESWFLARLQHVHAHFYAKLGPMARTRANGSADLVHFQVKIPAHVRDAIQASSDRSGVSMSYYVETLFLALLERGPLPAVPNPKAQLGEELPISTAA